MSAGRRGQAVAKLFDRGRAKRAKRAARSGVLNPVAAEVLEERVVLTSIMVTTLADAVATDGVVSLREAIQAANTNAAVNEAAAGNVGEDFISFASNLRGGTITLGGSELTITDTLVISANFPITVSGNNQSRVFYVGSGVTATISDLTITRGRVAGTPGVDPFLWGGGISNEGNLRLFDCTITGNSATALGGGISSGALNGAAQLRMEDSTVSGNTSGDGGGIYLDGISTNGGLAIIVNSTVSGNTASGSGGGIYSKTKLTLTNATVFGNRTGTAGAQFDIIPAGGGIWFGFSAQSAETSSVYNTIVAGNLRGAGAGVPDDVFVVGGARAPFTGNNLIGDVATAGGQRNGLHGNIVGVDWRTVLDPVLRNNGGMTPTHRLLPRGAAVDAGDDDQAVGPGGGPLAQDQRSRDGFDRIKGAAVDIGAYESGPADDLVGYLNGQWWVGESNGTAFVTRLWSGGADQAWDALGQADFNGDGRVDVYGLGDGQWWVGVSNGTAFGVTRWTTWSNLDWRDVKTADLNNDGRADILARAGGSWWAAISDGVTFGAPRLWASWAALDWREFFTPDLNDDGRADLLGYARGQWWAGLSNGTTFAAPVLFGTWTDAAWTKLMVLRAGSNGAATDVVGLLGGNWWIGRSNGTNAFTTRLWASWSNVAWTDPVVGNFDGIDGDEVAARHGGNWWAGLTIDNDNALLTGPTLWASWSNVAWKDVRVGDFDGDARDDIAGRYNGQWWVARSTGVAFTTSLWGTWTEGNWRGVGAADATGPPAVTASGSGGAFSGASAPGQSALMRKADEEPLALFWRSAKEDEEFARLLAGA